MTSIASMNDQQIYFDESTHRHPFENALHPMLYQQLEMAHLEKSLSLSSGSRLLDFGAGSGRVTFWFLKKGYDVTTVDVSKQSLKDVSNMYHKHKTSTWGGSKHLLVFQIPYLMRLLGRIFYTMSICPNICHFYLKHSNPAAALHFPSRMHGTSPGISTGPANVFLGI